MRPGLTISAPASARRAMLARTPLLALALALTASALAASASASASGPASIAGHWLTQDRDAVMEIAPCGSALCGKVVRYLKPPKTLKDVNNPDPAQRSRSLVGANILSNLQPDDGRRWRGRVYNPLDGKTYKVFVSRTASGLDVKGCWGPFCQTQKWTPAK